MGWVKKDLHTVAVKGGKFRLTKELQFRSKKYDKIITAPIGYCTDFASLPRVARLIINRNGKSRHASVIHDVCYSKNLTSRKAADDIFLEAMKCSGVNYFVRQTMYLAVRAGGWLYFDKNKERDVPDE